MLLLERELKKKFYIIFGNQGKVYPTKCSIPKNSKEGKKVFFNEQCVKLVENNRRLEISSGKLEIAIFHPNMGTKTTETVQT